MRNPIVGDSGGQSARGKRSGTEACDRRPEAPRGQDVSGHRGTLSSYLSPNVRARPGSHVSSELREGLGLLEMIG